MSPHAGKHSVYFVIYPWSKNLLWILHEWVQGTCTVMLLHSNLETCVLSSELLALLNAGQCVRGVCIRIQERIAVSERNWCSGTHWFQTTNGPPFSHCGSVSVSRWCSGVMGYGHLTWSYSALHLHSGLKEMWRRGPAIFWGPKLSIP
jgi:hypothetical protein